MSNLDPKLLGGEEQNRHKLDLCLECIFRVDN